MHELSKLGALLLAAGTGTLICFLVVFQITRIAVFALRITRTRGARRIFVFTLRHARAGGLSARGKLFHIVGHAHASGCAAFGITIARHAGASCCAARGVGVVFVLGRHDGASGCAALGVIRHLEARGIRAVGILRITSGVLTLRIRINRLSIRIDGRLLPVRRGRLLLRVIILRVAIGISLRIGVAVIRIDRMRRIRILCVRISALRRLHGITPFVIAVLTRVGGVIRRVGIVLLRRVYSVSRRIFAVAARRTRALSGCVGVFVIWRISETAVVLIHMFHAPQLRIGSALFAGDCARLEGLIVGRGCGSYAAVHRRYLRMNPISG